MDKAKAAEVLQRFEHTVKTVALSVTEAFADLTEVEDTEQEARLLVLSYAGLITDGRLAGKLDDWEYITQGRDKEVKLLLARQLKMDLNQIYGREAEKRVSTLSVDVIEAGYVPPTFDIASSIRSDAEFRRLYPTLALWLLDDMTEDAIADLADVTLRTVERRVNKEKRQYLTTYAKRGGLRVEGDETLAELQEACAHLKAAGR